MADDKATMTLNLTKREMAALDALAGEMDLSKTAVVRSSLRLFQMVHERIKAGETMSFSGDQQRVVEFIGPGFGQ
ncbi:MAG: transcriptional regulator [Hyphomonadaceae bacterium]